MAVFMSVIITLGGILLADYEINFLLLCENSVKVFCINNDFQNGIVTVGLVGKKIEFNIFYLQRDYLKLKKFINFYSKF